MVAFSSIFFKDVGNEVKFCSCAQANSSFWKDGDLNEGESLGGMEGKSQVNSAKGTAHAQLLNCSLLRQPVFCRRAGSLAPLVCTDEEKHVI